MNSIQTSFRNFTVRFIAVIAIAIFSSSAMANHLDVDYKVYIPHLTGVDSNWTDTLVVNNKGPLNQTFTVTLFNSGLQVAQESFLVQANEERIINIKTDINMSATLGVIEYHSAYLTFRMDYQFISGGLAEFRLSDNLYSQAIFNFSNIFPDVIQAKGIAVANYENSPTTLTLNAIGNNRQVLGSEVVSLNRRSRIVGPYSDFFPNIDIEEITGIIVSSTEEEIGGIVISSNSGATSLLFTQAADASTFTQEMVSEQVMIENYFPTGEYVYEGSEGVEMEYFSNGQEVEMFIYVDGAFFRSFHFEIDQQGALKFEEVEYPWGQKWTNSPFEIIPAEADLNRSFTRAGTWEQINKYSSNDNNVDGIIEVSLEGPFYKIVDAGAFPGVLKMGLVDRVEHSHFQSSSAVSYDFITFWLSEDFGLIKATIDGFEFEMVSRQEAS